MFQLKGRAKMPLSEKDKKRRSQKKRNKSRSTSGREKDLQKKRSNYHAAKNGKNQLKGHAVAEDNKGTGTSHSSTKWNQSEPAQFESLPGKVSL